MLLSLPDGGGAVQCVMERIARNVGFGGVDKELSIVQRYMYGSARLSKVDLKVCVHVPLCQLQVQTAACLHFRKTDFQTFSRAS